MAKFMSVEMSEHRYPVRFRYLGIRSGSGGPGRHRGGCGTEYGIETLSDSLISILGDRVDHAPFGVEGGGEGAPNRVSLETGGKSWIPPMRSKAEKVPFKNADSFHLASPGGGGFGDPFERDPAAIEADLNDGMIDLATAEKQHGIVAVIERTILDRPVYRVDAQRTRLNRSAILSARKRTA
jgi:N-methylhydantoinase B